MSDEALRAVHAIAAGRGEVLRQMAIFPTEIAVPDDATPEVRFLGYIGREPRGQVGGGGAGGAFG